MSDVVAELTHNGAGSVDIVLELDLRLALDLLKSYARIRRARLMDMAVATRAAGATQDDFKSFIKEISDG